MTASFFTPFPVPELPKIPAASVCVTDFGATETSPLQVSVRAAMEHLGPAGGRVVVPAGHWHSGAIELFDHIELHLEKGAVIHFSRSLEDYLPPVLSSYEGLRCYRPAACVHALDREDVALTGEGLLDGQGDAFWDMVQYRSGSVALTEACRLGTPVESRVFTSFTDGIRHSFVEFTRCRRVLLEGVTLKDSPMWNVHPLWSKDVTVRNITIDSPMKDRFHHSQNTDGINLDGCSGALVEGCTIFCGDDGICLKSGKNEDGRAAGYVCENVEVRNCRILRGIGGITVGSETSGGVRNLYCHDIEMGDVCIGLWVKSTPERGGVIENLSYENLHIRTAACQGMALTLSYENIPADGRYPAPPVIRNIAVENLTLDDGAAGVLLEGLPGCEPEGIHLKRVSVRAKEPMVSRDVRRVTMEDCCFTSHAGFVQVI